MLNPARKQPYRRLLTETSLPAIYDQTSAKVAAIINVESTSQSRSTIQLISTVSAQRMSQSRPQEAPSILTITNTVARDSLRRELPPISCLDSLLSRITNLNESLPFALTPIRLCGTSG
ncbi:uncharacterized protein PV07_12638 [Cladophialophora immunda]|uniref:Uncharacterized protein n=1 Tax=Cladophialophora immunda TaxID=569365 RepID=A0A0D2CEI8_9EURO|nr:uncharacterized protein PV07_12638 [Cladophialophora immunda]KIW21954.1 hypothetical protein PV07_12638 [Cladophialophora immunda]